MSEQQKDTAAAEKESTAKKTGGRGGKKTAQGQGELQKQIETLQGELAAQKDQYLRLCAEYDNFRKRTAREKADIAANTTAKAAEGLLPVIDNFERALAAQGDAVDQGLSMIYRQFCEYLTALGITELPAEGESFDPNCHVAVMHVEDESLGQNVVVQVLQKGYALGDKIVRPACVQVAN